MLNKRNRLTRAEIEKTFAMGSFFRGQACVIRSLPSQVTRVAVSVPKKIAKTAVARNRLRRFVYDACRQHNSFAALRRDVVFTINKSDTSSVMSDIDTHFSQLTK